MEQYNDDERVEDLKKWWTENGASIIVGILLGLAAIIGWQYWNSYRDAQAEKASQAYDAFVKAVDQPADGDRAVQNGQSLLNDFPKSPYAALTALRLAKLAMDRGDTAAASQRLEWVISYAGLDEIKDVARLRLARVRIAAAQLDEAQKLLESVATASLTAEREELKGDLYLAGNDKEKARSAYATALAARGDDRLLQLKLDNLAASTPESVVPAPTAPPAPAESVQSELTGMAPPPEKPNESVTESAPIPAAPLPDSSEAPKSTQSTPVEETEETTPTAERPVQSAEPAEVPVPVTPAAEGASTENAHAESASVLNNSESVPVSTPAPDSASEQQK